MQTPASITADAQPRRVNSSAPQAADRMPFCPPRQRVWRVVPPMPLRIFMPRGRLPCLLSFPTRSPDPGAQAARTLAVVAAVALAACSHVPSLAPAPLEPEPEPAIDPATTLPPYHLQVGDVLAVRLLLNLELNKEVTVRPDVHICWCGRLRRHRVCQNEVVCLISNRGEPSVEQISRIGDIMEQPPPELAVFPNYQCVIVGRRRMQVTSLQVISHDPPSLDCRAGPEAGCRSARWTHGLNRGTVPAQSGQFLRAST
jgi:hypothetical protein